MEAASPWAVTRAAEGALESRWVEEETWLTVGAAAAGPCVACVSSRFRPHRPPRCSRHNPGDLLHRSNCLAACSFACHQCEGCK